jgi:hypothetical protein
MHCKVVHLAILKVGFLAIWSIGNYKVGNYNQWAINGASDSIGGEPIVVEQSAAKRLASPQRRVLERYTRRIGVEIMMFIDPVMTLKALP